MTRPILPPPPSAADRGALFYLPKLPAAVVDLPKGDDSRPTTRPDTKGKAAA